MKKGDIIFVPFPFTDLSGNKMRPALVLADSELDVIVAFISTQFQWKEETDIVLQPNNETGLKKESLVRLSKLATIDKDIVLGRLGLLDKSTLKIINNNLKIILQLN